MKKLALCIVFLVLGALALGCTQMNARNIAKMAEEKYGKGYERNNGHNDELSDFI